MRRKGFPESYDLPRLVGFLSDVKAGRFPVSCPVYSHLTYDIVPGETVVIDRPDIVILEGLNVLQTGHPRGASQVFVSDFFDFGIYVDAPQTEVRRWYIERFCCFGPPRSSSRTRISTSTPPSLTRQPRRWRARSGTRLTARTCARTSCRRGSGLISSWRRARTTRCGRSGSGSYSDEIRLSIRLGIGRDLDL